MRACPGHEGYFVTEHGDVYSSWRRGRFYARGPVYPPKKLRCSINSFGYVVATLGPTTKKKYVHVLVLEAFIGPRSAPETRHLNGIRHDNRLENLCWATVAENQADRVLHGTSNRGDRNGSSKLSKAEVVSIKGLIAAGQPLQQVAIKFGCHVNTVRDIANGRTWGHV